MKLLFFNIILIFAVSCRPDQQSVENKPNSEHNSTDTLLGTWIIGSFISKGATVIPYISSKINFQKNGYALHTFPGSNVDSLTWFINEDTMNLKYINPKTKLLFFGRKYKMTFFKANKPAELRLSTAEDFICVLTRSFHD